MLDTTNTPERLTIKEVCALLNVPYTTLSNWRFHKKNLPYYKDGKYIYYLKSDVEEFMASRHEKTNTKIDTIKPEPTPVEVEKTEQDTQEDEFLNSREVAKLLGVKLKTIENWRHYDRYLRFYKKDNWVYYKRSEVEAFKNRTPEPVKVQK